MIAKPVNVGSKLYQQMLSDDELVSRFALVWFTDQFFITNIQLEFNWVCYLGRW